MTSQGTPAVLYWSNHVVLLLSVLAALITILGAMAVIIQGFTVRTLRIIDRNQSELFGRMHTIETAFHVLLGEHNAMKAVHGRRHDDG
jgi:hypothetical protein